MPTYFVRMTLNSRLSKYFPPVPLAQANPRTRPVRRVGFKPRGFRMPAARCFCRSSGSNPASRPFLP
jgi:hypothetical protein